LRELRLRDAFTTDPHRLVLFRCWHLEVHPRLFALSRDLSTIPPMPRAQITQHATRNTDVATLVPLLLAWFAQNARDLPWRRTRDPYAIWVSEIMLQQTQVKTVLPYWERWMRELPTIDSLAAAHPDTLHKLWEGLGYYTRVRNMHRAAREILAQHHGRFPEEFELILALPGIGRYTAGAISSIAFNQPAPVLDGNVLRVLTRIFGITQNPRAKKTNARLWQLAAALVRHALRITHQPSCSHLNQSLMELGARLCTPRQPKCELCPVATHCVAFQKAWTDRLPNLAPRAAATPRRFVAFIAQSRNRFLVRRRPADVVNAHLWEFPNIELNGAADDWNRAAGQALGFLPKQIVPFCVLRHTITRFRITLHVFHSRSGARPRDSADDRWLTLEELAALSFPSAHRKILQQLEHAVPG
jgi:A/G-specific adenine glycosylase